MWTRTEFPSRHRGDSSIPWWLWDILSVLLLCLFLRQTFPGPVPALSIDPRYRDLIPSPGGMGTAYSTTGLYA